MIELLNLIDQKYLPKAKNPRGHNWAHCNQKRKERTTARIRKALEAIGRPATRGEITKQCGVNIDNATLGRITGLTRTGGKVRGRAAWFYCFEETPT